MNNKFKNCPTCQTQMASNAKNCPNCGAKNSKPIYLRPWFIVLAVIIVIGIAVNGSSKDEPKVVDKKDPSTNETVKKEEVKKEEQTEFNIGDVIELKDYRVTVNSVRRDMGKEYFGPKDGNEFYYVNVTVENISDSDKFVMSSLFGLYNSEGSKMEQNFFANTSGSLTESVSAGRSITGEYAVEVPVGSVGYELEFDSSYFSSKKPVIIKLD